MEYTWKTMVLGTILGGCVTLPFIVLMITVVSSVGATFAAGLGLNPGAAYAAVCLTFMEYTQISKLLSDKPTDQIDRAAFIFTIVGCPLSGFLSWALFSAPIVSFLG